MLEGEECRYQVLEILSNPSRRQMCNLRTELFMVAAASANAEMCLMPFPSCFFDRVTKTKMVEDLKAKIDQVPKLSEIDESTVMDAVVWELLYWVFTNPLTIQPVPNTKEVLENWSTQTGLQLSKLNPHRCFLYTVVNPTPKKGFLEGKAKYGTKFAFHGSSLENFHSVVHRGLIAALNKRSAYGVGSYLSTAYNVSLTYSGISPGWKNSEIGTQVRCVAICEVVDDPSITQKDFPQNQSFGGQGGFGPLSYYVVAKDELIQLSHLIMIVGG